MRSETQSFQRVSGSLGVPGYMFMHMFLCACPGCMSQCASVLVCVPLCVWIDIGGDMQEELERAWQTKRP